MCIASQASTTNINDTKCFEFEIASAVTGIFYQQKH